MAGTLETFIAFGADIFAVERSMRLLQAVAMIFTSYSGLIALAQPSGGLGHHVATRLTLVALQDWFNVTRRSMRTFWFLRAFQSSYLQFTAAGGPKSLEDLLDATAGSLLGIFGLLETITLPDMTRITGLAVFGKDETKRLNVQAQMFWFLALLTMVLSSGVKIFRLLAERAVPAGTDFGTVEEDEEVDEKSGGGGGGGGGGSKGKKGGKDVLAKKREAEKKRKQDKEEAARKTRAQISALALKIVSDTVDMVIPANVCGWSNFHPGQVGIAMALTSLITLKGHWERCARALQ
ncbi:hypothetical protein PWT90_00983 [Aphanocladium album]|nr:hypothetical protein PWT90_00983 [Aphanocladium album]